MYYIMIRISKDIMPGYSGTVGDTIFEIQQYDMMENVS